ncbi:tRNA (uridine(54)-C5)-methyltransferase TrmA [Campylobacter sp. 19-13652]|uniref:tRNA (uridine(54)-C5)-methyltransferase TrmA n=1 Tax=Campylobacter sp. 19-13652 TaxID=2840180 RepID=UPI001C770DFE|nr:tRNA (uridine(54)-C5)-methyltransferase TrmA [Campylobacter sp. 19-13652]BCX79381.1 tRNA/tmRNA (uracil-C(5))-methyltransferase [Campylobacter sp. 19-13652]
MLCKHFSECGSCVLSTPYDEQVLLKTKSIADEFSDFFTGEIEVFKSEPVGYRTRAEFGLWHEGDSLSYTMHGVNGARVMIDECPKVDAKIFNLMPVLLEAIKSDNELKFKIFGVEFISTDNEIMAILLYHKKITHLSDKFKNLAKALNIKIVARSRGERLFAPESDDERLTQSLNIAGRQYVYKFSEGAFIQPNTKVNEMMVSWALSCVKMGAKDMLELYCGHGNFTLPLSTAFKNVLATEISKSSIKSAAINTELNGIANIKFIRMDADELISALRGDREFRRLEQVDLSAYEFSHVLLDPPRAGLSQSVREFVKSYDNIIYISCNPATLKRDLSVLCDTFYVGRFAFFDQFAHTHHAECGVCLRKRNKQ